MYLNRCGRVSQKTWKNMEWLKELSHPRDISSYYTLDYSFFIGGLEIYDQIFSTEVLNGKYSPSSNKICTKSYMAIKLV